jgi:hypothetical protein
VSFVKKNSIRKPGSGFRSDKKRSSSNFYLTSTVGTYFFFISTISSDLFVNLVRELLLAHSSDEGKRGDRGGRGGRGES